MKLLPADSTLFPQVSFPVTFQLDAHTHTHTFSLSHYSPPRLCDASGKKKKGKKGGKKKVSRKKRIDENVSIIGHIH